MGAAILTVVALVVGGYRVGDRSLAFRSIRPGETLPGTAYRYVFQLKEVMHADGTLEKSSAVFLTDDQGGAYQLPGNFVFRESPGEFICDQCVALLQEGEDTYMVTRSPSAGSPGTYEHRVVNLREPSPTTDTIYPSCGQVYRQGAGLVFPHLAPSCPGFWAMVTPQPWEYSHVPLSSP
ncbi:hypothetical protein GFS31_12150 [Leptolyngbya sp. BL0902]|uniref:hypothetical protein n=1 Tax=Leptolyngbya sp. BL0902 TaxID=1115757 RepID=UPI0018E907E2|nr:hypothetical protein [Leptolyngbya sp. BL0902]QQE64534.1 hypothetical protein GFS31_12150 [Leptolyngbya sp. BL0902]